MKPSEHQFEHVRLPGRAGELQDRRDKRPLIQELGDNYERYHHFLKNRLVELGGRPEPAVYSSIDDYCAAWAVVEEIVHGEALLRRAEGVRKRGRRLEDPPDLAVPLVDGDDRLVSRLEQRHN